MRTALLTVASSAVLLFGSVAFSATVTIQTPVQGQNASSASVPVTVATSQDFQAGRDGLVEIWVDGGRTMTLKGTSGTLVNLVPGNHSIQARLVTLQGESLRVPATSEQITITVTAVDPRNP